MNGKGPLEEAVSYNILWNLIPKKLEFTQAHFCLVTFLNCFLEVTIFSRDKLRFFGLWPKQRQSTTKVEFGQLGADDRCSQLIALQCSDAVAAVTESALASSGICIIKYR